MDYVNAEGDGIVAEGLNGGYLERVMSYFEVVCVSSAFSAPRR